jgi:hypothetical protein
VAVVVIGQVLRLKVMADEGGGCIKNIKNSTHLLDADHLWHDAAVAADGALRDADLAGLGGPEALARRRGAAAGAAGAAWRGADRTDGSRVECCYFDCSRAHCPAAEQLTALRPPPPSTSCLSGAIHVLPFIIIVINRHLPVCIAPFVRDASVSRTDEPVIMAEARCSLLSRALSWPLLPCGAAARAAAVVVVVLQAWVRHAHAHCRRSTDPNQMHQPQQKAPAKPKLYR